jgi:large subunit ribosomal protein L32e
MADTSEKKAEKKVVKEPAPKAIPPAPKAPEHGQSPAPKAPEHGHEHAHKEAPPTHKSAEHIAKDPSPIKKVEAKAESKAEPKPVPKAEAKIAAKKEEPKTEAPKKEASGAEPPAEEPSPSPTGKTSPAGEAGEVEGEIVEEPGEKTGEKGEKGEKGKTGKTGKTGKKGRKERRPHIKPQLTAEVVKAMALRRELKDKTPNFIRQEAYNYGRLGQNWRKPRGTHSKMRHHIKYRINVVSIGYGGPNASKGLHPSGFREVLVHHPLELDLVDPKTQAARIAHGVGFRKRLMIEQRAQRKGIRVLNELREE